MQTWETVLRISIEPVDHKEQEVEHNAAIAAESIPSLILAPHKSGGQLIIMAVIEVRLHICHKGPHLVIKWSE